MKLLFLLFASLILLVSLRINAQVIVTPAPVTCTTYCTSGPAGDICTTTCN